MTTLRPYQQRAVDFLGRAQRSLCVCPAGGGKTIIGAATLKAVAAPWDRIGWLCNTREQAEQGEAALARMGVVPAWVRCAAGLTPEDTAKLDFLVIDECHHLLAATWHLLAYSCPGRIIGLTATPKNGDIERDFAFREFWGENVITIKREEVIGSGHLCTGRVVIIDIDEECAFDAAINGASEIESLKMARRFPFLARTPAGREELLQRARWRSTLEMLMENPARNSAVVALALREIAAGQSVLILVAEIAQGERFVAEIPGSIMAHSKMGIKKRRQAIADFRDGTLRCMVATSLADEGLDVPRASVLIMATVGRSARLVEQRTGRVMRPSEGKAVGLVYDFADTGASMAKGQSIARRRIYKRLGYAVDTRKDV